MFSIIYLILSFLIVFVFYIIFVKLFIKPLVTVNVDCKYRRYGCCEDKLTPKLDPFGSNCRGF